MSDDAKDPRVKDLIEQSVAKGEPLEELVDAVTARELERWFGLPSFTQVAQGEVKLADDADPDVAAVRARQARALEAVDPALLDAIESRYTGDVVRFEMKVVQHVNPDIALFDHGMLDNRMAIAEPREYPIPEDFEDRMKEAAPQAMLRDLHRPETEFWKQFEVVDVAAEQRLDASAAVASAMATNWKLPVADLRHTVDMRARLREVRDERNLPWSDLPKRVELTNRKVAE